MLSDVARSEYRLYTLDGRGTILTAAWLSAASDEDAVGDAKAECRSESFELWRGATRVYSACPEPRGGRQSRIWVACR